MGAGCLEISIEAGTKRFFPRSGCIDTDDVGVDVDGDTSAVEKGSRL